MMKKLLIYIFEVLSVITLVYSTKYNNINFGNNKMTSEQNVQNNTTQRQRHLKNLHHVRFLSSKLGYNGKNLPEFPKNLINEKTNFFESSTSASVTIYKPQNANEDNQKLNLFSPFVNEASNKSNSRCYQKSRDGRNICKLHKTIQIPIKTTEVYSVPKWRYVHEPCKDNQICTRVRIVHETSHRDVIKHKINKQIIFDCCPGWAQEDKFSNGCTKPICKIKCQNGGTCIRPETCSCPPGYEGKTCNLDINECKEHKPCDQLCFNTEGSYYCQCRQGFLLGVDKQSCKKIKLDNNDAFEARDLELDDEEKEINARLQKIERMMANDRANTHDITKTIQSTSNMVDSLNTRLNVLEHRSYELHEMHEKLEANDAKTRKLEHLVIILLKCKNNRYSYCP